jgi:hypothetical protein
MTKISKGSSGRMMMRRITSMVKYLNVDMMMTSTNELEQKINAVFASNSKDNI